MSSEDIKPNINIDSLEDFKLNFLDKGVKISDYMDARCQIEYDNKENKFMESINDKLTEVIEYFLAKYIECRKNDSSFSDVMYQICIEEDPNIPEEIYNKISSKIENELKKYGVDVKNICTCRRYLNFHIHHLNIYLSYF